MKKTFQAAMALLFIASVSAVSAATIMVTSAADSGDGTLRDAVKRAGDGSVIAFNLSTNDAGYNETSCIWNIRLTSGEIKFRKALTIRGGGTVTISGRGKNRIFNYEGTDTLTLSGITFHNGKAAGRNDYGAGGAVWSRGSVVATGCAFFGNAADRVAGAVFANQSVTFTRCEFSGNKADLGGGAVYADKGSVTATDCAFAENVADKGSAVSARDSATLAGCTFTRNAPKRSGYTSGAVCADTVTATDCTFTGNTAHNGGAINAGAVTAEGCEFSGNKAKGSGGAAHAERAATVTGCAFTDNAADSGGAVSAGKDGDVTATDCTFTDNAARDSGGAVNAGRAALATGCAFSGNTAVKGGALSATQATVWYCAFAGNKAKTDGGAACTSRAITVAGSVFIDNEAVRNGGAVYASGAAAIANCSLAGNRTGREYSGAIDATAAYLYHATVADNTGSGVYIRNASDGTLLHAYNSVIVGNSAKKQAGFGALNKITVFPKESIVGNSLVERVTGNSARTAVFGANRADTDGIIPPRTRGPADKAADALTEGGIATPPGGGISLKDVIAMLRTDITGTPRPTAGKVSHGAKE